MGCGWGDRLNKTKRIITCALLTTVALALFAVELLIPPFPFCPGAKIGLANIITLFMLSNRKFFRVSDCFGVLLSRCMLSAMLTGRILSVAFSLSGGLASMLAMLLIRKIMSEKSVVCISISGAVFHNIAQILVAVCLYGTFSALYYIPALFIVGVLCGILTGLCVRIINKSDVCRNIFKLQ